MMTLGLSPALGSAPAASGPPVVNPNLLTKTEQFGDAAWTKTSCSVSADFGIDPLGGNTADRISNASGSAVIAQVSATAAASGSNLKTVSPTSTWARVSVTATLDIGAYTFSVWLRDPTSSAYDLSIRLDVSGGFIRVRMMDVGDTAVYQAWGAKLEAGSSPTGDASTYGAVG